MSQEQRGVPGWIFLRIPATLASQPFQRATIALNLRARPPKPPPSVPVTAESFAAREIVFRHVDADPFEFHAVGLRLFVAVLCCNGVEGRYVGTYLEVFIRVRLSGVHSNIFEVRSW